jgi:RNA-binding protein
LALSQHELVKVKLSGADKDERQQQVDVLLEGTESEKIHQIGHVIVLYRRNEDEPKLALPR